MSDTTLHTNETLIDNFHRLLATVLNTPARPVSAIQQDSGKNARSTAEETQAHLVECFDNGYLCSESKRHVTLPRFARAHLKTLVKTGGWG